MQSCLSCLRKSLWIWISFDDRKPSKGLFPQWKMSWNPLLSHRNWRYAKLLLSQKWVELELCYYKNQLSQIFYKILVIHDIQKWQFRWRSLQSSCGPWIWKRDDQEILLRQGNQTLPFLRVPRIQGKFQQFPFPRRLWTGLSRLPQPLCQRKWAFTRRQKGTNNLWRSWYVSCWILLPHWRNSRNHKLLSRNPQTLWLALGVG